MILVLSLLLGCVDAASVTSTAVGNGTLLATPNKPVTQATKTADFSSAVKFASTVSWELKQLDSIPAIPLPTNITETTEYAAASQLAPAMPPLQRGIVLPDAAEMVADLLSSTNKSSVGKSLAGRQSPLRVMIVGVSMSQGQEGDWTWRYRIWQWFQQNGIAVDFVGPYAGTVPPPTASPPSPPAISGSAPTTEASSEFSGGYARGVDQPFLSDSEHFAVWGRAAAVDKGLIQGVLEQHPADLMLLMLGFNDMGWFYSDAPGTVDSIRTLISNARAANPSLKFAVANVPHRSFIGGREDLVENTNIFNGLIPSALAQLSTTQSPIHLVHLAENYDCQPESCPAGERE